MSKIDEAIVMYPSTLMRAERLEESRVQAERVVAALRRWLRSTDDSLPDVYDGNSWAELEKAWMADA